jgi:tetratricopeptide (TPR) repeat protein
MLPTRTTWTIILSKQSNAWGAFSYDRREDAARVTVTPKPGEFTERLQYNFDDPSTNGVALTLRWEKLAVSLPVTVNTGTVVLDSLKNQLRDLPRFFAPAWQQAANWALANTQNLDLPGVWADSAILIAPTFSSYNVKARVLDRQGKTAEAAAMRQAHLALANEAELNAYGYLLVSQKQNQEALAIFIRNTKEYPGSWNTWDSLGEIYATMGDKKKAVTNYEKALAMTTDPVQKARINGVLAGLK